MYPSKPSIIISIWQQTNNKTKYKKDPTVDEVNLAEYLIH